MAKLGAYYALCPLIDANSILGFSEELGKDMVIVTLGKNISSRYKLSDQKQLNCWRTKEKFSSPVIYDSFFQKYVAVFNKSYIKMWDLDENLDDSKKYKLNAQIHNLISSGNNTFIVFQNGAIHELSKVIQERKKIIPEQVVANNIKNVICKTFKDDFYIGLLVEGQNIFYWTLYNSDWVNFRKIVLSRDGYSLRGQCFHQERNKLILLTFWSDGSMFSHSLEDSNSRDSWELFSTVNFISTNHDVSMLSLDDNYLALYGADCNQEGAVFLIYNTQFKVIQTRQSFKLFTDGAKLFRTENAVLLPVGQNLAVVPFQLEIEQLVALIGSHKIMHKEIDEDIKIVNDLDVASWVESHKIRDRDVPDLLKEKISELVYQGMPENMILDHMLPNILKNQETKVLSHCLRYFTDLSEKHLVQILKFLLDTEERHFKGHKCDIARLPETLQPLERVNLLDTILKKHFNETLLLPQLRIRLSLNNVLLLLNYIYLIGSEEGYVLPGLTFVDTESKLIEWCSILIDSSYQKIVLSDDESVKKLLEKFSELIDDHLLCLKDLKEVTPLLMQLRKQKNINRESKLLNSKYFIEQLSLYQ